MRKRFVNSVTGLLFNGYIKKIAIISLCVIFVFELFSPVNQVSAQRDRVYVDYNITADTVWNADTDYIICYLPSITTPHEIPKVNPGVTLTIQSGATVSLGYSTPAIDTGSKNYYPVGAFYVEGNIVANGVVFTGVTIDTVQYSWDSIIIQQGTVDIPASGTFSGCIFERGGRDADGMLAGKEANLIGDEAQEVNIGVDDCTFQDAYINSENTYQGIGFSYSNGGQTEGTGEVQIRNSTFRRLGTAINCDRNGTDDIDIFIYNCAFTEISKKINNSTCVIVRDSDLTSITYCTFSNIGDVIGSDPYILFGYEYNDSIAENYPQQIILNENTFDGGGTATTYPIEFYAASSINFENETYSNNFINYPAKYKYAHVYGWIAEADTKWGEMGIGYLINDDVTVGAIHSSGWPDFVETTTGTLTILPGQTVTMLSGGKLTVRTNFVAEGTADKKIKFNTPADEVLTNPTRIDIGLARSSVSLKYCEFDGMTQGVYGVFPADQERDEDVIDGLVVEDCNFKNMKDSGMLIKSNNRIKYDSYTNNRIAFVRDSIFENNQNHGYSTDIPDYAQRDGDSGILFTNCIFRNNTNDGLYLHGAHETVFENCLIYGNGGNGVSVVNNLVGEEAMLNFSSPPTFTNCTIANNSGFGIENEKKPTLADYNIPYGARVANSIISGNTQGDLTYNASEATSKTEPGLVTYSLIENSSENFGWGCIKNEDPLFANELTNDYHLKSQEGRFNGITWVNDAVTSPCINSGDSTFDYSLEPSPNGSVINMGFYGNTEEASKLTGSALPGIITNLEVVKNNYNTLNISWDATQNVDGYELYRSTKIAGEYTLVYSGSALLFADTGLTVGTKYYYTARTFKGNEPDRLYGSFVKPRIFRTYNFPKLATPTGLTAVSTGATSIRVSWDEVLGATGYTVWRKDDPLSYNHSIGDFTTLTVADMGLTTGQTYTYSVRAFFGDGEGEEHQSYISDEVSATPISNGVEIGTPAIKVVSAGYNKIKLTWNKITGATKYEIHRSLSKTGTFSKIAEVSTNYYTNSSLTTGKTYYYKIRAKSVVESKVTYGKYSAVKYAKPLLSAPAKVKIVRVSKGKLKLYWGSVSGATGFEIFRATSKGGTYKRISTLKLRSYTNTKLIGGKTYYYKIRAYRMVGKTKVYSKYSLIVYAKA